MVISVNSQLGLRFNEHDKQIDFLRLMIKVNEDLAAGYKTLHSLVEKEEVQENGKIILDIPNELIDLLPLDENNNIIPALKCDRDVRDKVNECISGTINNLIDGNDSKYFFICDSVYKAANLIKVNAWFSGRTLKDINFGKYTYLMGKSQMVRFFVGQGAIKGFYYNDKENIVFEWGIEMEDGAYYFDGKNDKLFTMIMQVLTFIELGDIEITELAGGRNNGGLKNKDKITNTDKNTVYVVDSSWNKLIIRTDGFAVRGHFRLQPCGEGMKDRKLLWINAFEKHGYKRQPKASILHD